MTTISADNDRARLERLRAESRKIRGVSLGRDAWRRLVRDHSAFAALIFLILLAVLAVFTPFLPLQPPQKIDIDRKFAPPVVRPLFTHSAEWTDEAGNTIEDGIAEGFGNLNAFDLALLRVRASLFGRRQATNWLGTDELGRDQLARLCWGARVSLLVGLVAALVSLAIGVSYGAVSGYVGGWVDAAMMRLVDVLYSVPFIFIVIFLITVLSEPEVVKPWLQKHDIDRIMIFYVVVGGIYWLTMARVVRGQVLSLKQQQFVEAARTIGAGRARIIFQHIVPNLLSVIIVYLTLTIPRVMLFEAFLSFLGLGVEPPDVSWGLLANDGAKHITPVGVVWWLIVGPGVALGATCVALNRLGDGLRDAFDPRLKNR